MHNPRNNVLGREHPEPQSFEPALPLFGRVSNQHYREAVAQTVRDLKAEKKLTNERLAEILGCAETTVYNAENEHGNLDAVTMLNLAALFGGQARLKHILALVNGCPAEPETPSEKFERIIRDIDDLRKETVG